MAKRPGRDFISEVNKVEITINSKQLVVLAWTMIAIAISIVVVIGVGLPFWGTDGTPFMMVAGFFLVWLLIILPVYLLIAIWGIASKPESD
jgi:fatty acid desaturase